MEKLNSNDNKVSLFEKLNFIALVGALIYFTGWMYCYRLFKHFGILSCTYDIPMYHILLYSYSIIFDIHIFLILLSLLLLIYLLYRFLPIRIPYLCPFIILYILFLIVLNYGSKIEAHREINRIMYQPDKIKYVKFILKENDMIKFPSKFYDANNKGELVYIHSTKDRYYVFFREKDRTQKSPGNVFDIPVSNVSLIEIAIYK